MSFDYEAIRAKTQRTLIAFLDSEVAVGRTLVQSAALAKSQGHMNHYVQARLGAVQAAECLRRFMSQVADDTVRTEIGMQLAELDRIISTL